MSDNTYKPSRFDAEAAALPNSDINLSMPVETFLGEALDVARSAQKYWPSVKEPLTGNVVRYGLDSAGLKCPPGIVQDLLDLHDVCQDAETGFHLAADPPSSKEIMKVARFVLREVSGGLEWHLDDGVEDADDVAFAKLANIHEDTDSIDGVASALFDYCTLAKPHAAEMDGIGGFKSSMIEDGFRLAKELRLLPPSGVGNMSDDARQKLDRRNRLLKLLQQRVGLVRGATRFVYRDHPEIAREFTSKYERRKRAALRRAKAAASTDNKK